MTPNTKGRLTSLWRTGVLFLKNLGICYRGGEKFGRSGGYGRNRCQQQSVQIAIDSTTSA